METPSQATTIAAKLAKYAYPNSPLLPNSKSPHRPLAPATPTSEAGGPSTPTPTRSRKVKREPDVEYRIEDEDEGDEDSHTPSKRPKVKVKSGSSGGSGSGKKPRPFAGPEVYAHLRPVQDLLKPDLDSAFLYQTC